MTEARQPISSPTFACDDMLGKLARTLRMIGYFAHYFHRIEDKELVSFAAEKGYVLLTRDTLILPRKNLGAHLFVKSDFYDEQLQQVVSELNLTIDHSRFYTICLECNKPVRWLTRSEARGLVPPYVFSSQKEFSQCPECLRLFWPATHRKNMNGRLRVILGSEENRTS